MSALVNPITVDTKIINFSFPAMIVVVVTMLIFLRTGWRLVRWEGFVLLGLYVIYLVLIGLLFGFEGDAHAWISFVSNDHFNR
jgi:cation:H+ antiporter